MLNVFALSKSELKKRMEFRCVHRHNGVSHPICFDKKFGLEEKIGFLDIESSNLNSNWGFIFSYCIKKEGGEIVKRILTPKEIKTGIYDKHLLEQFCKDVRKFDRVITFYGKRFDIPFLRTRCVYHKLDFPIYKEIKHTDLYFIMKYKFKLHSNRLGVVSDFFGIKAKQHPMNPSVWFRAMAGHKDALNWIMTHNIEDVNSTEELWNRINQYTRITNTSI